jgi:putative ABC transport system ATP-binding protein
MNEASPIIDVRGLTKIYRTEEVETHALTGIELSIRPGEYVAAMGPSGCGKTTLLSILGLLETPTGGEYRISGMPVGTLDASERARMRNRHIGFVFQAFNLIGDLSVEENVELPLIYRGGIPRSTRRERVRAILDEMGMSHRLRHYPGQLSGGQQQRVAIARALVGEPSILLADEPTGNLDSKSGEAVMELLAALHERGATLFMVTHDPRYAQFADRLIRLIDGQIVDDVDVREGIHEGGLVTP